jgi:hypothetical protein
MQLRLGFTVEELVERDERLLSQLGRLPAFVQNGELHAYQLMSFLSAWVWTFSRLISLALNPKSPDVGQHSRARPLPHHL